MAKILETVTFAREVAHFTPDVIVIDHFDIDHAAEDAIAALRGLARERNVELWLSALQRRDAQGASASSPRRSTASRRISPSSSSSSPSATSCASACSRTTTARTSPTCTSGSIRTPCA